MSSIRSTDYAHRDFSMRTPIHRRRDEAPEETVQPFTQGRATSVVERNNALGFAMLGAFNKPEGPQSGLVSPLSVTLALGMLAGGGDASTQRAFCDKFGVQNTEDLGTSLAPMMQVMRSANPGVLTGGNAVFAESSYRFKPSFSAHVAALGAETNNTFDSLVDAENSINEWVSAKTNAMIPKLVSRQDLEGSHLALVNALSFTNQWQHKFDPNSTRHDYPFQQGDAVKPVSMMVRSNEQLLVSENGNYTAVCLPYQGATSTSGLFFVGYLPNRHSTVGDVLSSLQQGNASEPFRSRKVLQFGLPKFSFESSQELKEQLATLGFPMHANFSEMGEGENLVSTVLHKTKIKLDEEGTRAAAATAILVTRSAARPQGLSIFFDRPFVFSVVDASQMAVFTGIYA